MYIVMSRDNGYLVGTKTVDDRLAAALHVTATVRNHRICGWTVESRDPTRDHAIMTKDGHHREVYVIEA